MSNQPDVTQLIRGKAEPWPTSESKVLIGFADDSPLVCPFVCPFTHVSTPQGQGKEVAGRGWETEAKVSTEGDLELKVLPQVPASGAGSVQYKAGMGVGGRKEERRPCMLRASASQKPPWNLLTSSLRELLSSLIYRGGLCSSERESDVPESPRE